MHQAVIWKKIYVMNKFRKYFPSTFQNTIGQDIYTILLVISHGCKM